MAQFHRLQVIEVTRETADCVSLVFDVPAALKGEFNYVQGQYLTLKLTVNGEEFRRSYSICSSPVTDNELRVAVKKVKNGRVSTFINDLLKVGDLLDVMSPIGNFHAPLNAKAQNNYVMFAGGSGITPMLSIIKTVLNSEPKSTVRLFYGNRDEASTIFKKQLDAIALANPDRFQLKYIFENGNSEKHFTGVLSLSKVKELLSKYIDWFVENIFFICGPAPMMENVKQVLQDFKVDPKKINIEYFTAVVQAVKAAEEKSITAIVQSRVTVILDDAEFVFDLDSNGVTILDVAQNAGLDVPFACKGGVCCTCRAKLMEGKVSMDQNFALSEEEIAAGYILTCQSHPITENVIVSFDEP